jgi:ABC-type phosphate transport system substrate-binding protein
MRRAPGKHQGARRKGQAFMNRPLIGSWRRFAAAAFGASVLALATSSAASANFTPPYTEQCSGGEAVGITTGVQQPILSNWSHLFEEEDTTSPLSCAGRGPLLRSTTDTSLETLEALGSNGGVRNPAYVFAANEEPPTLGQWLSIDLGNKPGENSGLIRQIPVASTAVVPLVHFPEGCAIPAGEATGDGRFTVSNTELEKVYAGEVATWGALLPDIESSCASIPIERVVPEASEGTTFVFKQWLSTVDSARGWGSLANTAWPNDSGATATVRAGAGDRNEASLVAETSGSVGFASLANARTEGFGRFSPENPKHLSGLFWLSVLNGAGERVEPTRDPNSGADNVKGANCDNPTFNHVPSGYDTTVTPIWRAVSAAGSKTGWPICTLTYVMAWDDASTVYGGSEEVQAKQRTVKDLLAYILGADGQEEAKNRDYSPLPATLLADAQEGASRVGWDKLPGSKEEAEDAVKAAITAAAKHSQ